MADCFVVEGIEDGIKPHSSDGTIPLTRAMMVHVKTANLLSHFGIDTAYCWLKGTQKTLVFSPRVCMTRIFEINVVVHKHVVEISLASVHRGFEKKVPSRGPSGTFVQEILHVRHR